MYMIYISICYFCDPLYLHKYMISLLFTSAKGGQKRNYASVSSSEMMVQMHDGFVLERIVAGKAMPSLTEFPRCTKQKRTQEMELTQEMKLTRKSRQIMQSRFTESFLKRTCVLSLWVTSLTEFLRCTKQKRTQEMELTQEMKLTRKSRHIMQSRFTESFVKKTCVLSLCVMSS